MTYSDDLAAAALADLDAARRQGRSQRQMDVLLEEVRQYAARIMEHVDRNEPDAISTEDAGCLAQAVQDLDSALAAKSALPSRWER